MSTHDQVTVVDCEGHWRCQPTRFPRGQRASTHRATHLDTITATLPAVMHHTPAMRAIGTGAALDGESDHRLVVCDLAVSAAKPPSSVYAKKWMVSRAQADPNRQRALARELDARGSLHASSPKWGDPAGRR